MRTRELDTRNRRASIRQCGIAAAVVGHPLGVPLRHPHGGVLDDPAGHPGIAESPGRGGGHERRSPVGQQLGVHVHVENLRFVRTHAQVDAGVVAKGERAIRGDGDALQPPAPVCPVDGGGTGQPDALVPARGEIALPRLGVDPVARVGEPGEVDFRRRQRLGRVVAPDGDVEFTCVEERLDEGVVAVTLAELRPRAGRALLPCSQSTRCRCQRSRAGVRP